MWGQLHNAWSRLDGADFPTWKKSNQLFEAIIEQVEPQRFLFSLLIPDAGEELYKQVMGIATLEDALYEGNKLIFEFLAIGVEMLGNFRLTQDRPADEVRLKQLAWVDGEVFGLDEEGVVFKRGEILDPQINGAKKTVWIKQSMERFDNTKKK